MQVPHHPQLFSAFGLASDLSYLAADMMLGQLAYMLAFAASSASSLSIREKRLENGVGRTPALGWNSWVGASVEHMSCYGNQFLQYQIVRLTLPTESGGLQRCHSIRGPEYRQGLRGPRSQRSRLCLRQHRRLLVGEAAQRDRSPGRGPG